MKWVVLGLVGALLLVGFFVFGGEDVQEEEVVVEDVLQEEEVIEEVEEDLVVDDGNWTQEVNLVDTEEMGGSGVARRGISGNLFTHAVVAELPAINEETQFYEGWLVVPGVTEFFSTGAMFPREDGKWGLVWEIDLSEARDDLLEYREVVITREPLDDDPAPSIEHAIEGTFDELVAVD